MVLCCVRPEKPHAEGKGGKRSEDGIKLKAGFEFCGGDVTVADQEMRVIKNLAIRRTNPAFGEKGTLGFLGIFQEEKYSSRVSRLCWRGAAMI